MKNESSPLINNQSYPLRCLKDLIDYQVSPSFAFEFFICPWVSHTDSLLPSLLQTTISDYLLCASTLQNAL